jgi:multicomponent K+:H+ antiporter subunit E
MSLRPPVSARERWLPHPMLSSLLAASWLLLMHTYEPVQVVWAVVLGLAVPVLLRHFLPAGSRPRMAPALRLFAVVLWDIVVANVTVARLVLGPMSRLRPAWVRVPLDATHPTAIALLATIITTTPGTVSCVIDEERGEILVHALDCDDPQTMACEIKQRYETPLRVIFEREVQTRRTA